MINDAQLSVIDMAMSGDENQRLMKKAIKIK